MLNRASREEQKQIDAAIDEALGAFPLILEGAFEKAMNTLHSRKTDNGD